MTTNTSARLDKLNTAQNGGADNSGVSPSGLNGDGRVTPTIPRLNLPTKSTSPQRPQKAKTNSRPNSNQRTPQSRSSFETRPNTIAASKPSSIRSSVSKARTPTSTNTPTDTATTPIRASTPDSLRSPIITPMKNATAKERISRMFTPPKSVRVSSTIDIKRTARPNSAPGRELGASVDKGKMVSTLDSMGLRVCEDETQQISIETFDPYTTSKVIISSPRSIESCLRAGIPANDLLKKTEKSFAQPGLSKELIELRYNHFEKRRQEKVELIKAERLKIIEEDERAATMQVSDEKIATIEKDKLQVEKALRQSQSHMEQLIAYEIQNKKKAIETERRMTLQKQKDEEERKRRADDARNRELARIKKQIEHKQQAEKLLEQQKEQALEKQRQVEEREELRRTMMDLKQKEKINQAEAAKKYNEQRIKNARLQHAEHQNEIMTNMETKEKEKQRRLQEFEEQRKESLQHMKQNAVKREQKVQETKQMANVILQNRINKINERRSDVEVRQRELAQQRQLEDQKKKLEEENKEIRRSEVIENAKKEHEAKIESLIERQKRQEEEQRIARETARKQQIRKLEEERLKEQDRLDLVERTKRQQEFKQMQTLAMIDEKKRKVELIEKEKNALIEKKVKTRLAIERTRQIISGVEGELDEEKIRTAFMTALSKDELTVTDWEEFESICKTSRTSRSPLRSSPNSKSLTGMNTPSTPANHSFGTTSPTTPHNEQATSPLQHN